MFRIEMVLITKLPFEKSICMEALIIILLQIFFCLFCSLLLLLCGSNGNHQQSTASKLNVLCCFPCVVVIAKNSWRKHIHYGFYHNQKPQIFRNSLLCFAISFTGFSLSLSLFAFVRGSPKCEPRTT